MTADALDHGQHGAGPQFGPHPTTSLTGPTAEMAAELELARLAIDGHRREMEAAVSWRDEKIAILRSIVEPARDVVVRWPIGRSRRRRAVTALRDALVELDRVEAEARMRASRRHG